MPIYEYRCEVCQHSLEALQKLSDEPLQVCPKCNASALRKQVSAGGFCLKGGGWYETDFKSGNKKNVAGDSGAPAESGKNESPTSESPKSESSKSEASKGENTKSDNSKSESSGSKVETATAKPA